jgi:hypothetical protein
MTAIEVAHVRIGSQAGVGQKPDDFRTVSLCRDCHAEQHRVGERTFWKDRPLNQLLAAFCANSPKRFEIAAIMTERSNG